MSISKVAQLAGVSISTVSRVINAHPSVAPETASAVKAAIKELEFVPRGARKNGGGAVVSGVNGRGGRVATAIGFMVFGTSGATAAPAFSRLLQGVSGATNEHGLSLVFGFVSDPNELPGRMVQERLDGVLLHGELPGAGVVERLKQLPSVWLMANRVRPTWGDQVMPDNNVVGEIAASYLLSRGHRKLAYLGSGLAAWYLGVRILSFRQAAAEHGIEPAVLTAKERARRDFWRGDGLAEAGECLVEQWEKLEDRPTGLFVSEDRLLPVVHGALMRRGIAVGHGRDVEIIGCNNEQPHLLGVRPMPATIELRAESIGRRGVEQLVWRMGHADVRERVRTMIEPVLVQPNEAEVGLAAAGIN